MPFTPGTIVSGAAVSNQGSGGQEGYNRVLSRLTCNGMGCLVFAVIFVFTQVLHSSSFFELQGEKN